MNRHPAIYFGCHYPSERTLKRAILLYDELHFIDRGSFSLGGQFGAIGQQSPMRHLTQAFNQEGLAIVCHSPISGLLPEPIRASIAADLQDRAFVSRFIDGFFNEQEFSRLFLRRDARYMLERPEQGVLRIEGTGEGLEGTGEGLMTTLKRMDWRNCTFDLDALIRKGASCFFDATSEESMRLTMAWFACEASFTLNSFLVGAVELPGAAFTDMKTYHDLLQQKYARQAAAYTQPWLPKDSAHI